nr:MAG TPA: hypothetical protein [Bacteriophage sp.]
MTSFHSSSVSESIYLLSITHFFTQGNFLKSLILFHKACGS